MAISIFVQVYSPIVHAESTSSTLNTISSNLSKASEIANRIVLKKIGENNDNQNISVEPYPIENANISYTKLDYTLDSFITMEFNKNTNLVSKSLSNKSSENNSAYISENIPLLDLGISNLLSEISLKSSSVATREDLEEYMNPNNLVCTKEGLLQFLRIDKYSDVSATKLNEYLNNYCKNVNNAPNVFKNKGEVFINAAKKYNIDPIYFVAHSMWETGYGSSTLAKGQVLNSFKGEALKEPVTVYNFFGIGAVDGSANLSGAEAAYANGWTSVDATIDGSAKWLSEKYIHNSSIKQNSLYKMRWNYENINHQYATDVNWANGIASLIAKMSDFYNSGTYIDIEIPVYK